MSNDTDKKIAKPEQAESTRAASRKKSGSKLVLGFIVLLLLATAYFANKEFQNLAQHKHTELTAVSSQAVSLKKNIASLQEQQAALLESINDLINDQVDLQRNIATLYQWQNNPNQEWTLAEVEYLLVIASHRLLLEADVNTALIAMQAADSRLKNLPDPGLLTVRKQLLADMNALRSGNTVDISGLALYLADLAERTGSLPLKDAEIKTQQTMTTTEEFENVSSPWWKRLLSSIWQELKGVIVISHDGEQAKLALLPQQSFFLRQNLRLQMETARYAVLRRDTELLHSSVKTINDWLTSYFAVSDNSVSNIIESLSQMRSLDLDSEIPDISSSLETIRAYVKASNASRDELENNKEIKQ